MKELKPAIMTLVVFTVLCGGLYPAVVTALGQVLFPAQAQGSLLVDQDGRLLGSALIGQGFSDPKYFWPRPSATAPFPYNPMASGGSNLGPTNPVLLEQVRQRLLSLGGHGGQKVPADLVESSASGLDPHLSPEAALVQVGRVAKARGLSPARVAHLVESQVEGRTLGILGVERVNTLRLNLALDREGP